MASGRLIGGVGMGALAALVLAAWLVLGGSGGRNGEGGPDPSASGALSEPATGAGAAPRRAPPGRGEQEPAPQSAVGNGTRESALPVEPPAVEDNATTPVSQPVSKPSPAVQPVDEPVPSSDLEPDSGPGSEAVSEKEPAPAPAEVGEQRHEPATRPEPAPEIAPKPAPESVPAKETLKTAVPAKPTPAPEAKEAKAKPQPKPSPKAKPVPKPARKPVIKLFGTVEFKGRLTKLPLWTDVLKKMRGWKGYFRDQSMARLPSRSGWNKLVREAASQPPMARLRAVNKFFNRWPYRLDSANFGRADYWATPKEFLMKSGDCEDYAIAKYYALKELGFRQVPMRIVAVRDVIRNIGHAVLAVYLGDQVHILDNQTDMVLPHTRYKHYVPQYSVDEHYRWMHIPVSGKAGKRQ